MISKTPVLNFLFGSLFLLAAVACGGEDDDSPSQPVTDTFSVGTDIASDGSGTVTFTATGSNISYYEYFFGEEENESPYRSEDGTAVHTYSASGDYDVEVRAHGTTGGFTSQTLTVSVVRDEPSNEYPSGYSTPDSYDGMTLVWRDEFEGNSLNTNDWIYEIGDGCPNLCGWGNNELQYYRQENTSVQDGYLTIEARQENYGGRAYTSSRIITQGRQNFQYGRVDIRAVLPEGQGIWPALWMLGSNINTVSWPACGEIDIMEMIGGTGNRDATVHGTIHWDNNGSYANYGGDYSLTSGKFSDEFHVFSIIWNASSITWLVDDVEYHTVDITPEALSEFRDEFFFIFNVAVGGNWPGSPDGSTQFPQQMTVDYVRIFQQQ
ncbi:family 16 glycosylhydrolase [Roseivirga sp. BDSF3-8]|uniref:family 16 glycosylhydrolase n=1 Tax=Roseivirga sp. BDSF3-8 TaxID=3241598 RepID=UPI0035326C23